MKHIYNAPLSSTISAAERANYLKRRDLNLVLFSIFGIGCTLAFAKSTALSYKESVSL